MKKESKSFLLRMFIILLASFFFSINNNVVGWTLEFIWLVLFLIHKNIISIDIDIKTNKKNKKEK